MSFIDRTSTRDQPTGFGLLSVVSGFHKKAPSRTFTNKGINKRIGGENSSFHLLMLRISISCVESRISHTSADIMG